MSLEYQHVMPDVTQSKQIAEKWDRLLCIAEDCRDFVERDHRDIEHGLRWNHRLNVREHLRRNSSSFWAGLFHQHAARRHHHHKALIEIVTGQWLDPADYGPTCFCKSLGNIGHNLHMWHVGIKIRH